MTQLCSVCNANSGNYKCPKCRALYCCLNCFKIHKQQCPGAQPSTNPVIEEPPISPFETFRSIKEIKDALGDPRLQKIISRIDSSTDREGDLIKEIQCNPEFSQFYEKLLANMPTTILP